MTKKERIERLEAMIQCLATEVLEAVCELDDKKGYSAYDQLRYNLRLCGFDLVRRTEDGKLQGDSYTVSRCRQDVQNILDMREETQQNRDEITEAIYKHFASLVEIISLGHSDPQGLCGWSDVLI